MNNQTVKRASGKRSKKRKFVNNQFTKAKQGKTFLNESASGRKIDIENDNNHTEVNDFQATIFIDLDIMFSSLEKYLCYKECGGDITLKHEAVCGLSSNIIVDCNNCSELCSFRNSNMLGAKRNIPEINRRFIYAFRAIGLGHAPMKVFCGVMNLQQPVSAKTYTKTVKTMLYSSRFVAKESMKSAAEEEMLLSCASDIIVSGDGTWKTRGHSSRVGVCAVIGDKTGKVIDTEVLSSYCKACDVWKAKKGTSEYVKWKESHVKDCLVNHTGSAGKMEVSGMVRIFERSEGLYNSRYVGYIGDGDAKTFHAITESAPYGPNTEITKIECVGHIQKRMGTRLRKLRQSGFKCTDGKSIGGKGRLTDKIIDKLTSYYGNAIRQHKNSLAEMRKAVWAIYFHTRSTDEEPLHSFCPAGLDSWCKFQKNISEGVTSVFLHKPTMPACVMDAIKPIFNDLSQPRLLQRCLGGKTQNSNESLNSVIWKLCPKTLGSGRRIVEHATNEATVLFNDGNLGRLKIMQKLSLIVGPRAKNCMLELDRQRVATAEIRLLQSTKEARKNKKMKQKALHEALVLKEGPLYAAGEF